MTVAYSASSVTVSDGTASADFTVKRSGTSSDLATASSVDYSTSDVTATAGTDYTSTSGTLSFAAGVTEATVSVAIDADAYTDNTATKTFLLQLSGYGSATGSISPSSNSSTTQTYLYIPDDDETATVPTADSPGDNLKYQALYSGFSTPSSSSVSLPMAYMRLGYARSDMNDYERVAVNSDIYHPDWLRYDGTTPVEPGAMQNFALPRGIDRRDKSSTQVKNEEKNNAHLDGMFLYSNANYNLTVADNHTTVVQGNLALHVEGIGRVNYYDKLAQWVIDKGDRSYRTANGVTEINGTVAEYDLAGSKEFKVHADMEVNYNFGDKYNMNSDVEMTISNAAKYEVSNSIGLEVTGYQIGSECDVYGNYSCKFFPGEVASTQSSFDQAASESICLSIQTGTSTAWTAAVAVAANANALAGAAISASAAAETFRKDSEFYKLATPDNLDSTYAEAFTTVVPDSCAGLAAVTAAIVAGACIAQKIADALPSVMPKIEMSTTNLELSVGESAIILDAAGVSIFGPLVTADGETIQLGADTAMGLTTPALTATAETNTITGNVSIFENLVVLGTTTSFGALQAAMVQVP